jgi:hypothetical protein
MIEFCSFFRIFIKFIEFEVHASVTMKNTIFLDLTPFIAEKFIDVSEEPTLYIIRVKEKARQPAINLCALWLYIALASLRL